MATHISLSTQEILTLLANPKHDKITHAKLSAPGIGFIVVDLCDLRFRCDPEAMYNVTFQGQYIHMQLAKFNCPN